ncbi:14230_t:CDS:2, partial [Racocetra persica]
KALIADLGISKYLDDPAAASSVMLMNRILPPSHFTILNKVISQSKEKYIEEISLNKKNNAILSDYADIYIKFCSSELDQCLLLDEISEKLENISNTTVEFIEINN